VVGIRYWLQRSLGLDVGAGVGWRTGSTHVTDVTGMTSSTDSNTPTGVAIHAGLPIAIMNSTHYSFLIIPETTFGFTSETFKAPAAMDINLSGLRWDIGGRVGAEVHFGFIGVPQLALQGSLGLFFEYTQIKASLAGTSAEVSVNSTSLASTVGPNPWSIFTNNISAIYYF
jgi:hypothetical protein